MLLTIFPRARPALGRRAVLAAAGVLAWPGAALANEVTGAGSTFASPILMRWGHRFMNIQGEGGGNTNVDGGLDYEPSGSGAAVARLRQRDGVDFGATDVAMMPEELTELGLVQFPFVSGGISIVVNLRGVPDARLRLNPAVLARILMARITDWSDGEIAALNPGLAIPAGPIAVIHRADGSGTTWNLGAYLAEASPEWRAGPGIGWTMRLPAGTAVRGSAAVLQRVATTPGAIGYAETGQAQRAGLAAAQLPGAAGRPLSPTPVAIAEALATQRWDAARQFQQPYAPPQGADAYPLTATVYAVMRRQPASRARQRRTLDFFQAALTEGGADAAALGYVPLPESVTRQVFAHWQSVWR